MAEPVPAVPQSFAHGPVFWRFVVCDRMGNPVSIMSPVMDEVEMIFRLNRPASLTFSVPSDSPLVNIPLDDGYPTLAVGRRVIKCYRKVSAGAFEDPGGWVLKLVVLVWSLQDQGDGDTCRTSATCFDHLKVLDKRALTQRLSGIEGDFDKKVAYTSIAGARIIIDMIDTANGIAQTGLTTIGAVPSTVPLTVSFSQNYVLPAITSITDTLTVDIVPTYLDATDGDFLHVGMIARRGSDQPDAIFGYSSPPRNSSTYSRVQSLDVFANSVYLYAERVSADTKVHEADAGSRSDYGLFEDVSVLVDIKAKAHAADLAVTELAFRKDPREMVELTPAPEISPLPFDDYDIGDTVTVYS